jgi:hypothetical protein
MLLTTLARFPGILSREDFRNVASCMVLAARWLAGWLAGELAGWLAGCLAGWLAG